MSRWISLGTCIGGLLLLAGQVLAQTNTATVYGTVQDQSKAVVSGAGVLLQSTLTGLTKTTTTNGVGQFTFNFVPVGQYAITVSHPGFEAEKIENITLSAAQVLALNFALKIASQTQSVQVTSQEPLLNLASSDSRNRVSNLQLNNLPVQNQDWTTLLKTAPSAIQITTPDSPAGTGIVLNGLPPASFNLTVDGTNASSDPEMPSFGFYQQPNIINTINNSSIEEVSIVRGIAPASVSGTMSGNINIITRGGTNQFHGNLYEINDVSLYNARNQFLTSRPRSTFNQYGGYLGGPILRNKLFFFGSYEGVRLSALDVVTADVPSPYLISISPSVFQPVFSGYPPPPPQPPSDPTALTVRVNQPESTIQNDGNGSARIDYNLNGQNSISLRYVRARPYSYAPRIIAIDPRVTTGHTDAYNATYIHTATSWTSNARFAYNRIRLDRNDLGLGSDFEEVIFSGFDSAGAEDFKKMGGIYTGEEGIAITHGRHTLQVGGIYQRQNGGRVDLNTTTLSYSDLSDFQNNIPSEVQITFDLTPFTLYTYQLGGYLQDDYRLTPNLTLNLGFRYDYFSVPKEYNGRVFNRGVDPASPQLGPGFGPYRPANSMYNADFTNFQPRVGFSWGLGPNSSTVLRSGFGIFSNPHPLYGGPVNEVQTSATQPFRVTLNRSQALAAGLNYPVPRANYTTILQELQSKGVISPNFANSAIDPNFPNPYSMQWMLGIEQAFPGQIAMDLSYVGNRALHANINESTNLPNRITGIAPDPTFSEFAYYTAGDAGNYNGLQLSVTKRYQHGLSAGISYTWSRSMAFEQENLLDETPPQDNNNIKADYGPTPFDVRNNFVGNFLWQIPFSQWSKVHGHTATVLLSGWKISGLFSANDGFPINLTNGDSSYPSDRPDGVPGTDQYLPNYHKSLQYLNTAAFQAVPLSTASGAQIRGGDLGRDAIRQPGMWDFDAGLGKVFSLPKRMNLEMRMDAFNSLNHTNLTGLVSNTAASDFGQLTSATARTVQISGRLNF